MRIKTIISQHRRDFQAVFECEHCGGIITRGGYDDDHFHRNVVPALKCANCGKSADKNYRPLATKYPEGAQV